MATMEIEKYLELNQEFLDKLRTLGMTSDLVDFKPYINTMARYLPNDNEALMRFSRGLEVVTECLLNKVDYKPIGILYQLLASMSVVQAVENKLDLKKYIFARYDVEQKVGDVTVGAEQLLDVEQAAVLSKYLRKEGVVVGLIHGHFRLLTPSSIAFVINAQTKADIVLVGVEKSERTRKFKTENIIFSDEERAKMFRRLLPFAYWIDDETEYSNEGYGRMLKKIRPDVYIGQSHNPETVKIEMKRRAGNAGCEYVELLNLPGLSTTRIYSELIKAGIKLDKSDI